MLARYRILARHKQHPVHLTERSDFDTERIEGIELETVIADPHYSLGLLDMESGGAIFLRCPDPEGVEKAAFLYMAQYDNADELVEVPFPLFHEVAARLPSPRRGWLFVHSVGRCGSTLVSKVLQSLPGVLSLSEPDEATYLGRLKAMGLVENDALSRLLDSSIRWRHKGPETYDWVALKFRAEAMVLATQFAKVFPTDRHLFLYRDGLAWMRTLFRGWPMERDVSDLELNRKMAEGWRNSIPLIRDYWSDDAPLNPIQIRMLAWVTAMEGYLDLRSTGVQTCAIRFEDIQTQPRVTMSQMLHWLGISSPDLTALDEVLARDSQAGTIYDREQRKSQTRELTPELVEDVRQIVESRPRLVTTSVVLPGTLG